MRTGIVLLLLVILPSLLLSLLRGGRVNGAAAQAGLAQVGMPVATDKVVAKDGLDALAPP